MPNGKDKKQHTVALSFSCILLAVALTVTAGFAWFSMETAGNSSPFSISVGKVEYTIADSGKLFYSALELSDDYIDDDFDEEGGYIPAQSIGSVMFNGTPLVADNGAYSCSLELGSNARLTTVTVPAVSTDRIRYSSSNPDSVMVSPYGTIRAVGIIGSSSVITVTLTDREPASVRGDITAQITVTVIQNEGDITTDYGYLPGGVNILRQNLELLNTSTVDTKLRTRIEWNYTDFDNDEAEFNEYKQYSVDQLLAEAGATIYPENISTLSVAVAPLSLQLLAGWNSLPADSIIIVTDANGMGWNVSTVSLRDSDKLQFMTALTTPGGSFSLNERMIDGAYAIIAHSANTILATDTDYGDVIPRNVGTSPDSISVLSEMLTSESYASYSTRKVFSVLITVQARQAKAYSPTEEGSWFNVFCTKEKLDGTEHSPTE